MLPCVLNQLCQRRDTFTKQVMHNIIAHHPPDAQTVPANEWLPPWPTPLSFIAFLLDVIWCRIPFWPV